MSTKPRFDLTLAACGSCDFHWPQSSLKDIRDYHQRVDENCAPEDEPDGECPITGT